MYCVTNEKNFVLPLYRTTVLDLQLDSGYTKETLLIALSDLPSSEFVVGIWRTITSGIVTAQGTLCVVCEKLGKGSIHVQRKK